MQNFMSKKINMFEDNNDLAEGRKTYKLFKKKGF